MGFLDEVAAEKKQRGPGCSVAVFLKSQPPKLRGQIVDELAKPDEEAPTAWIWRALRKRGYPCGQQAIGRHRKGDCACGR